MDHLNASWNYPTQILSGIRQRKKLPGFCFELGMRKPLIVTDPGLEELGMADEIGQLCKQDGLEYGIFSKIKGNPSGENVMDGCAVFQEGGHDGVIALGGGSALDAAKAIALMVGQNRPLWDFEDVGDNWTRVNEDTMAPVVAIPTTAGTGSEVGRASVITNSEERRKIIIFHPKMLPTHVILDAELTVGLPAHLTAATGMDALSHSLEAYCATYFHPMAEGIALESMRLVKEYLPIAVGDGSNLEARQQMLVASSMGATAFQRGLGAMHALAHSLGALYDAHHGLLNAILMPYVLVANRSAIEEKMDRLSSYLGLQDASFDGFVSWVLQLRSDLNIPNSLSDISIDEGEAEKVSIMATEDPSAGGNPIIFTSDQYKQIFLAAVRGDINLAADIRA